MAILTFLTPKDPLTNMDNVVYNDPEIAHCVDQCCPITDPHSPMPGVLGHRDSVRGCPGCVCDAQPGLALAAHPLGCPTPPLCCSVFCRYPLRHLSLCYLVSCRSLYFGGEGVEEGTKATFKIISLNQEMRQRYRAWGGPSMGCWVSSRQTLLGYS